MATHLERIVAAHRRAAADDRRPLGGLIEAAAACPPPRDFRAGLRSAEGLAVIAEIKRRSPSRGALDETLVAGEVAAAYRDGGAACLSVLTESGFFGGSPEDLAAAREASGLPVLRKDFTVVPADVCDARIMGADAVLLIVAALDPEELATLAGLAADLGLAALVEVHGEDEVHAATAAGADLVGVNQRDLATFEVDPARARRLRAALPEGVVAVAESGVKGPGDARVLADAGYDAVLVGESLVLAGDRAAAVAALRSAGSPRRSGPSPVGENGSCS